MTIREVSEVHLVPQFAAVSDAFASILVEDPGGAAVAIYHRGRQVVALHGGTADPSTGRSWTDSTTPCIFSTTKGLATIVVLALVHDDTLRLDEPITDLWPELAAGNEHTTLRDVLAHRAGLPAIDAPLHRDDVIAVTPIVTALAEQEPEWQPGTAHGYHALTFGYLLGELVRRTTRMSLGTAFRRLVAEPLHADAWIGLPPTEHHRLAPVTRELPEEIPADQQRFIAALTDSTSLTARVFSNPALTPEDFNDVGVLSAEMPAGGGVATADALARIYAACIDEIDGIRILTPDVIARATAPLSDGDDLVLRVRTRFGLGFMVPGGPYFRPPSATAFGHPGAGGSIAFADPGHDLAFAFVTNTAHAVPGQDARVDALLDATYRAL